jgi:hypothetical protein
MASTMASRIVSMASTLAYNCFEWLQMASRLAIQACYPWLPTAYSGCKDGSNGFRWRPVWCLMVSKRLTEWRPLASWLTSDALRRGSSCFQACV